MTAQGLRLLTVTRMTSLFRRSSSGGGSRGGEGGQLNNSRPSRQVRRLEFNQAMEDFRTMFPSVDYEVIECVLRSNNGAVDATIDQLLQMSVDGRGSDDSSDSDDSIPAEVSHAPSGLASERLASERLTSERHLSRSWSERWSPTALTRSPRRSTPPQPTTCTCMTGNTPRLRPHRHPGNSQGFRGD